MLIFRLLVLFVVVVLATSHAADKPNIIYILADDLGYGDLSCLNKESKIKTVNMDRLATGGMIFTDAHSGSSVCTPTRYGVMTGRYAWRTYLRSGVLWGWSRPLIDKDRLTVPELLKKQGYRTACLGKWHLGMEWALNNPGYLDEPKARPETDYTKKIKQGPTTRGFDYYYGISASLDMPPYCWIENDRTVGLPTATKTLFQGRTGLAEPDFESEVVLPGLARKAVEFISKQAAERKPFFIYMPLNSPHTPIAPNKEFVGKSGLNPYADFVLETDAAVGQVLDALERTGVAENTLVILTSDNGCSPQADYKKLAEFKHNPSHIFRGTKADIFEGGHRVPFLAKWPAKVKAGSQCDATVCLTDLLATCAEILGKELPEDAGEDSVSILPHLLGTPKPRDTTVHQSANGTFAIRHGNWKLIFAPDSGGWSVPRPGKEAEGLPAVQLYDLSADIGETKNLQAEQPEVVARLTTLMQKCIDDGRSTPGKVQKNDVAVPIAAPVAAKK